MQIFKQSPTHPRFVQNPYPAYDRARAMGDLVWWDDYQMPAAVTYRAVRGLLTNRKFGREALTPPQCPAHLADWQANESHSMLELEPPRHSRLRGLVLRAFTSKKVAAMTPEIIDTCHRLIDAFPTQPFDFLNAFARPLPVHIIAKLLGVPTDRSADLLSWSNAMVAMYQSNRSYDTQVAANQATLEFTAFLDSYIAHRRSAPRDDLLSDLIAAEEAGEKLTGPELISTCILLLNAGHEATVHTLGNALKTLLPSPYRDVTPQLVEEVLRFDPPLHLFTRFAYEDTRCFGFDIHKGQRWHASWLRLIVIRPLSKTPMCSLRTARPPRINPSVRDCIFALERRLPGWKFHSVCRCCLSAARICTSAKRLLMPIATISMGSIRLWCSVRAEWRRRGVDLLPCAGFMRSKWSSA